MPAQVPNTGFPAAMCAAMGSNRPVDRSSLPCVVLSPPGRITRSIESSKSSAARNSFHGAPRRSSMAACSANAPCTARMPVTPCFADAEPAATSADSSFEMYSTATTNGCSSFRLFNKSFGESPNITTKSGRHVQHRKSHAPTESFKVDHTTGLCNPRGIASNQAIDESTDHSPRAAIMV